MLLVDAGPSKATARGRVGQQGTVRGRWERTENMRQVLSWYTASCAGTATVLFSTLPDSPVRIDWSHLEVQQSRRSER